MTGVFVETWKRVQNMDIVALSGGVLVGRLDDFQFDLDDWNIYGWRVKGQGMFAPTGGLRASEVTLIGRDVVLITGDSEIEWSGSKPGAIDGRAWASGYCGMEIVNRRGAQLGVVKDFVVESTGSRVTGFILNADRMLILNDDVKTGPDVVICKRSDLVMDMPQDDQKDNWWARIRDSLQI